jgi:hypothetical protein
MEALAARIGLAVVQALGLDRLAKSVAIGVLVLAALVLAAGIAVLVSPFALLGSSGGAPSASVPAVLGLWEPLAAQDAAAAGLPAVLVLGVMDHESAGQWTAEDDDSDGTTDAGLMQVNSQNWADYGLSSDPYAPSANVSAGVAILRKALSATGENVAAALEAYNAGTAAAGMQYDPEYAPDVMADVAAIEAGPQLSVGLLGGGAQVLSGARQAVIITAYAPFGPTTTAYGQSWPALVPPATLSAKAGATPLAETLCGSAPVAVRQLLPPDAGCSVVVTTSGASVTVTATWRRTVTRQDGQPQTTTTTEPVTLTQTVS